MTYPMTPVQLAAELGHEPEARPGLKVRTFLRDRYPEHVKNERWLLSEEQVDEVRDYFKNDVESLDPQAQLKLLMESIPATRPVSRELFKELHEISQADHETDTEEITAVLASIVDAIYKLEGSLSGHVGDEFKRNALKGLFSFNK